MYPRWNLDSDFFICVAQVWNNDIEFDSNLCKASHLCNFITEMDWKIRVLCTLFFKFCGHFFLVSIQGGIQKFFEGWVLIFFVWTGKFRGSFGIFFLKNLSKLKKFQKRGVCGVWPPKPLREYAPNLVIHVRSGQVLTRI